MGPRAGLDDVEKRKFLTLPVLELRPLGRPARSQSLYRLRYPDSLLGGLSGSLVVFTLILRLSGQLSGGSLAGWLFAWLLD
jgi:hypothetical protein